MTVKLPVSYVVLAVVIVITIGEVSAETALTDAEIELLLTNSFAVTIDEAGGTITLEHAGIPYHDLPDNWGNNPNTVQVQDHSFTLPLEATVAENDPGCAGGLGPIGFAVSGAVFYNPYTGFGWNAVEGECKEDLDTCWGHPSPDGTYHYHQLPECLYNVSNPDIDLRDMFLGVALDGYPIYGPMNGTNHSYTSAELDQCHGHTYNGRYMYRATFDFPYILSCFHGRDVKNTGNPGEGQTGPGGQRPTGDRPTGDRPPPDGGTPQRDNTNPCRSSQVPNWQALTCIVVCENAGRDLSNCPSRSTYNTSENTDVGSALSVVPSLALILVMCTFFAMSSSYLD